ncbi:hypothetical protein BFP72_10215 [Reichenbachiella sp. 5M10]|nr:hypothetical protein BFP72_10215 [Reichenbachiella sp. 5M10]
MLSFSLQATTYNCSTVQQITDALAAATAGDEIIIAAGTYVSSNSIQAAYYYGGANGTASNPIILRGASSSNRPHLKGNNLSSRTVLRIEGDYWIVKDLEISYGQKGLVFDNSNHSQAIHCAIHTFGNEAVHVRDGSDYVTIDDCTIYDTGNVNPGFGEGVYIGTDKGSWSNHDHYVDHTTVKNCSIGPDVRAEAFDIKEGSTETIVEYNTVDASGISGDNYADSFMDLKGIRTYVRYNTFNQNGEGNITRGIAVHDRGVELSGYDHIAHHNTFNMDDADGNIMEAYGGTSEVYAVYNTRSPSGDVYNSRITESCPSWYGACSPSGSNQSPSVSISSPNTGATLTAGDDLTLSAVANDSDGQITLVEFYSNGSKIGQDNSYPYAYTWSSVSAGNYTLTAVATDDSNAQTTSSSVSITVNASGGGNDGGGNNGGSSDLSIQYEPGDTDTDNNKIKPYIKIHNDGASSVPYADLTVRYWFSQEGSASPVFNCDYAALGNSNVNGTFVNTSGVNYYLEVSFDASAGSLSADDDSGNLKLRITNSDWSNPDETNDYSFDGSISSYTEHASITLYQNGTLVWGTEPNTGARTTIPTPSAHSLDLSIYPNPSTGLLQITGINTGEVRVLDLLGRVKYSSHYTADENNIALDLSSFPTGYYIVTIQTEDDYFSKKVFKK